MYSTREYYSHLDKYKTHILNEEDECSIAQQMFIQSYQLIPVKKYVSFLGNTCVENQQICDEFMDFFSWTSSLTTSLRLLASKLYLKGDSQHIDQVLESFSKNWCKKTINSLSDDYQLVHIICFALYILNCDFQSAEYNFNKDDFVKITVESIKEEFINSSKEINYDNVIQHLKIYYDEIKNEHLPTIKIKKHVKKVSICSSPVSTTTNSDSIFDSANESNSLTESVSPPSTPSKSLINTVADAISSSGSSPATPALSVSPTFGTPANCSSATSSPFFPESPVFDSSFDLRFDLNNFYEGIATTATAKQTHRFSLKKQPIPQVYLTVANGLLKKHSFTSNHDFKKFTETKNSKWVSSTEIINLFSSFAVQTTTNQWKLIANNKILVFNCNDPQEFIEIINLWAARITSIPSAVSIKTNKEFGWSQKILHDSNLSKIQISRWDASLLNTVRIPTSFKVSTQFDQINTYVCALKKELDEHKRIKPFLIKVWNGTKQFEAVLENWDEKYSALFDQYDLYLLYLESLALVLSKDATRI